MELGYYSHSLTWVGEVFLPSDAPIFRTCSSVLAGVRPCPSCCGNPCHFGSFFSWVQGIIIGACYLPVFWPKDRRRTEERFCFRRTVLFTDSNLKSGPSPLNGIALKFKDNVLSRKPLTSAPSISARYTIWRPPQEHPGSVLVCQLYLGAVGRLQLRIAGLVHLHVEIQDDGGIGCLPVSPRSVHHCHGVYFHAQDILQRCIWNQGEGQRQI